MSSENQALGQLGDLSVPLRVEAGKTEMAVEEILNWQRDTIIPLDKIVGEPMDVYISGRFSARGEVVVVNEHYGVRIIEIARPTEE